MKFIMKAFNRDPIALKEFDDELHQFLLNHQDRYKESIVMTQEQHKQEHSVTYTIHGYETTSDTFTDHLALWLGEVLIQPFKGSIATYSQP